MNPQGGAASAQRQIDRPGGIASAGPALCMPEDFDVTITPGAYLKHRRCAAGLSPADVAAGLHVEPYRFDERARAEWIELIEADAQPADLDLVVALKRIFPFDMRILISLVRIAQGSGEKPPRLCRICSCSEWDPCVIGGQGCAWVAEDVCSAHAGTADADAVEAAA